MSSVTVFNELIQRRPDLAGRLFSPLMFDTRENKSDGPVGKYFPIRSCCYADDKLRTFYHSDYFRAAE